ncbi:UNVERIFIED_CONTAM: hypothetical protein Slati_1342300 [Sesamum latifolium]|uniref:Reverse transcriptase domain-containing protein n=1 Tax=Sesamum latifolium TaxID=2727402 RepID=A0AAW2XHJ3_9LAMI
MIGPKVSAAVREFFKNGKLLKQVNTTLLALVPKVLMPCQDIGVSNEGSDNRLVDITQNTFFLGKKIIENVLLAQELLSRYNRRKLHPRCAIKGDIRKPYDSVEWDSFMEVLRMFQFTPMFIRWIQERVITASYSLSLNGGIYDIFQGARGKGQEERGPTAPMTSYFFCKAAEGSAQIFKNTLELFSDLSGLRSNLGRSQDLWHPSGQLIKRFPIGPRVTSLPRDESLAEVIQHDTWRWVACRSFEVARIM